MPGIVGMISPEPADICRSRINRMLSATAVNGFGETGAVHEPETGVYAGWAVRTGIAGDSLFASTADGLVSLLLAGECYHSAPVGLQDLLALYLKEELDFFDHLNGLFSGLLIDRRKRQAFLFNDRYSAERIYVHEAKDVLYFASEAKALLAVVPELRKFDDEGVVQFLSYGCTLNWQTLFRGIELLPGGSLWTVENKSWRKNFYFLQQVWERQERLSVEDFSNQFRETFNRILPRYFNDALPVGVSTTGGLDSRMILSGLPKTIPPPVCYTYTSEGDTLDSELAAQVAAACGLEHRIISLDDRFFENFAEHADRTVFCTDGCAGILGSHEIYLSHKAGEFSAVRLTGNYGSEVLRDMSTFKPVELDLDLLSSDLCRPVQDCRRTQLRSGESPVGFALFKEIPWSLSGTLIAGRSELKFRTPYLDNDLVSLAFRAPNEARQSARAALELIDHNCKALAAIPTNQGILLDGQGPGYRLRRAVYTFNSKLDYYCNEGLPDKLACLDPLMDVMKQHSRFFGRHSFMHYRQWFRTRLADYIQEQLSDVCAAQSPYWNAGVLSRLADEHIRGRKNRLREINAVLTLHAIERLLLH